MPPSDCLTQAVTLRTSLRPIYRGNFHKRRHRNARVARFKRASEEARRAGEIYRMALAQTKVSFTRESLQLGQRRTTNSHNRFRKFTAVLTALALVAVPAFQASAQGVTLIRDA